MNRSQIFISLVQFSYRVANLSTHSRVEIDLSLDRCKFDLVPEVKELNGLILTNLRPPD